MSYIEVIRINQEYKNDKDYVKKEINSFIERAKAGDEKAIEVLKNLTPIKNFEYNLPESILSRIYDSKKLINYIETYKEGLSKDDTKKSSMTK